MTNTQRLNLTLRAIMETGIVLAFAYWGYQRGQTTGVKILLAIVAPLLGFGIWGAIDFHQAGQLAEPLRLIEELSISGLAAVALYAAGQPALGGILGALSIVYHILVYLTGERLLKSHESV
ncbi:MAG: YrdB family protein [Caldilineaceae bacterium]